MTIASGAMSSPKRNRFSPPRGDDNAVPASAFVALPSDNDNAKEGL